MRNGTVAVSGSLPAIIKNDTGLYDGDLKHYFRVVFDNARNLNNPYYNFRHIFHVLWLCHDAIQFFWDDRRTGTGRYRRNLLIAGMFHDFDHTGIDVADAVNIERAISALQKHCHPDDRDHFADISLLISLSQFPYVIPSEKIELRAQILRDADASQALSPAWIQQVIFGLAEEWRKTPRELLEMQERFLGSLRFTTEWARQKFPNEVVRAKIVESRDLIELLR